MFHQSRYCLHILNKIVMFFLASCIYPCSQDNNGIRPCNIYILVPCQTVIYFQRSIKMFELPWIINLIMFYILQRCNQWPIYSNALLLQLVAYAELFFFACTLRTLLNVCSEVNRPWNNSRVSIVIKDFFKSMADKEPPLWRQSQFWHQDFPVDLSIRKLWMR